MGRISTHGDGGVRLGSECDLLGTFPLEKPSEDNRIAFGSEAKAAPPVGGPRSKALLRPEWDHPRYRARTKPAFLRPSWQRDEGKDSDLRASLALLDEAELEAPLEIAEALIDRLATGPREGSGDETWYGAVVHFDVGTSARSAWPDADHCVAAYNSQCLN
jgi:hypothetical protein